METAQQREGEATEKLQQAQVARDQAEATRKEASSEAAGLQGEAEQLRERISQDDQQVQV